METLREHAHGVLLSVKADERSNGGEVDYVVVTS